MYPPDPKMLAEDAKPERIHWLSWLIVVLGFGAIILFAVVPGVRLKLQEKAFRDIRANDSRERVVELMGEPDTSVEPVGKLHRYWGDEPNLGVKPGNIASVLTWRVWVFTGKVTWQVGLNAKRRAISKHRYD